MPKNWKDQIRGWPSTITISVVVFGTLSIAPLRSSWAEPPPDIKMFALPAPQLRAASADAPPRRVLQPPAEIESFVLRTGDKSAAIELLVGRHETMNGTAFLRAAPASMKGGRIKNALDLVLPARGALFGKNPNARRNLLVPDDW